MKFLDGYELIRKKRHEQQFVQDCIDGLDIERAAFNANCMWLILECGSEPFNFKTNLEAAMALWNMVQSIYESKGHRIRMELVQTFNNNWYAGFYDTTHTATNCYKEPATAVAKLAANLYREHLKELYVKS